MSCSTCTLPAHVGLARAHEHLCSAMCFEGRHHSRMRALSCPVACNDLKPTCPFPFRTLPCMCAVYLQGRLTKVLPRRRPRQFAHSVVRMMVRPPAPVSMCAFAPTAPHHAIVQRKPTVQPVRVCVCALCTSRPMPVSVATPQARAPCSSGRPHHGACWCYCQDMCICNPSATPCTLSAQGYRTACTRVCVCV